VTAQLSAAKATQQSAKLAMDSEIGGVNTIVAQIQAQLENASWELSQTTIRAPADGYVTAVAPTVGRSCIATPLGNVIYCRERDYTCRNVFAE
jgi:multidrug resistance efflux pump